MCRGVSAPGVGGVVATSPTAFGLVKVSFDTEVTDRTNPSDLPQRNSETAPTKTLGFIPSGAF
jgi:hypothetical protein